VTDSHTNKSGIIIISQRYPAFQVNLLELWNFYTVTLFTMPLFFSIQAVTQHHIHEKRILIWVLLYGSVTYQIVESHSGTACIVQSA